MPLSSANRRGAAFVVQLFDALIPVLLEIVDALLPVLVALIDALLLSLQRL